MTINYLSVRVLSRVSLSSQFIYHFNIFWAQQESKSTFLIKAEKYRSWITGHRVSSQHFVSRLSLLFSISSVPTIPNWLQIPSSPPVGQCYWPLLPGCDMRGKEPVRILSKTGSGKFLSRSVGSSFSHHGMTPVMPHAPPDSFS